MRVPVRLVWGLVALACVGWVVFGGWWAFERPALRMQAFCADIKPGTPLAEANDRSVAEACQTDSWGTDTPSCHVAHAGGWFEGATDHFA
ncbi:MAG: hypothetical protein ACI9U2_003614 [Bradymonadia bacterium]|jgi:hypothetical protein